MNKPKILIVKLSALGDVVQTLPSVTLLKKYLPFAEIDWIIDERNAEILEGHPLLRKTLIFSTNYLKSLKKLETFIKDLRENYYEVIVDYQGLLKSGLIVGLGRGRYKIGFSNHREGSPWFYNFKLPPYNVNLHAVKRYLNLTKKVLELLGNSLKEDDINEIPEVIFPETPLPEFLNTEKPYISLIPKARWDTKNWNLKHWEKLIALLLEEEKFSFFILGSSSDLELKNWACSLESKYPDRLKSLVGKISLSQVIPILKYSKLIVTVDTGPMHIASALRTPTVALFGPTSPERTGPWGGKYLIVRSEVSCSPCFRKKCSTKECMENLNPYQVKKAVEELLNYVR